MFPAISLESALFYNFLSSDTVKSSNKLLTHWNMELGVTCTVIRAPENTISWPLRAMLLYWWLRPNKLQWSPQDPAASAPEYPLTIILEGFINHGPMKVGNHLSVKIQQKPLWLTERGLYLSEVSDRSSWLKVCVIWLYIRLNWVEL